MGKIHTALHLRQTCLSFGTTFFLLADQLLPSLLMRRDTLLELASSGGASSGQRPELLEGYARGSPEKHNYYYCLFIKE